MKPIFRSILAAMAVLAAVCVSMVAVPVDDAAATPDSSTGCSRAFHGWWGSPGPDIGWKINYFAQTATGYVNPPESSIPICNQLGVPNVKYASLAGNWAYNWGRPYQQASVGLSHICLNLVPCFTHSYNHVEARWTGAQWTYEWFDSGWI